MSIKKINHFMIVALALFISTGIYAEEANTSSKVESTQTLKEKNESKYKILEIDQIDPTSTLAIPFDDSEMEDRMEIDEAEKRETFPIPK